MRHRLTVLAVAALLALGTGGGVAAALDQPTNGAEPPADYTVAVETPDELTDEDVDRAVALAWADDQVRSQFEDGAAVHFELWASGSADGIVHVDVTPADDHEDLRAVADVNVDDGTVTNVDEPVTLTVSDATSIDGDEYDLVDAATDADSGADAATETTSDDGNATRLTADESVSIDVENATDAGDDGTFSVTVPDGTAPTPAVETFVTTHSSTAGSDE